MTYTFKQLQRVHARVHELAETATDDPQLADAHAQRIEVMDRLMATMIVYDKRTVDRDELEPNVVTLIDTLLRMPADDRQAAAPISEGAVVDA